MLDNGDIKAYQEVCLKITGTAPEGEQAREKAERVLALVRAVYETEMENKEYAKKFGTSRSGTV